MDRVRVFSVLAASVWLVACRDGIGPPDRVLHHLRWSPDLGSPTFAAVGGGTGFEGFNAPSESAVRILDTYQTSFWARRGSGSEVEIRYQAVDGTWQPYLRLTVPSGALKLWPNGTRVADGDSVFITLALDTLQMVVQLEPTGLVFDERSPARLEVWYTGADPDLDASGGVDETDRYIESTLLSVWVQESPGAPWLAVTSAQSLDQKLFTAGLRHFSGYAVSH